MSTPAAPGPSLEGPSLAGAAAQDLSGAGASEWLEADGQGGYAMGTVAGPRTRRYHGLLCVALRPPTARTLLIQGLAETVFDAGGAHALDAHHYPGVVYPDGHTRLARFDSTPWPTWRYTIGSGQVVRELAVTRGRARTLLRWRSEGSCAGQRLLVLRPLISGRDAHALHHENSALDPRCRISPGSVEVCPYPGAVPGLRLGHNGRFSEAPEWYRRVRYPLEAERGLDCEEDVFSPGELSFDLAAGPAQLVLEREDEPQTAIEAQEALFEAERARRVFAVPGHVDPELSALVRAADVFVVRGQAQLRTTVIAGYPWFTDWGRDTFIAARGLGLAFGPALERALLLSWASFVSGGMIPNRFPEAGERAEYNAVDASLWYALGCARHLNATASTPLGSDREEELRARSRLAEATRSILDGYLAGTRHGIFVDKDGLVHAADAGQQLTWMDAKVGDWVVTPRGGKPVEVQALWVAALEATARLFARVDGAYAEACATRAVRARASFAARFWCEERGWLYDVVDGPGNDDTLRPNQLYALGLVRPLVALDRAARALAAVEARLLVPVGLRSRAPGPGFRGQLVGTPIERDGAYHEGTVWPFLLGIYADACKRVRGAVPPQLLEGVLAHLHGVGLGQIAEVFDGEAPHHPRGCPQQAWSIAEALRVRLDAVAED